MEDEVEEVEVEVEQDPWAAASDPRLVWPGRTGPDWVEVGGPDTPRY